ncbi:MAG TPA: hypothetical protein VLQ45_08850 [Thermoanaerobaculia bacterium]|nr:hypothetical protein [Thermoanaerobaculia bacterium]
MSSHGKARCIAVVLAAVLLLSAVVPAQAAVPGSRGTSSSVIDALWSWLGAAWEAFVPAGSMEKGGGSIDPNGGPRPEGALIDPNGGETVQSDQGALIDPNGGRP